MKNVNQMVCDRIDSWDIPRWMMDIINDSDYNHMDELYGDFETEDELIDFMEREYGMWYAIMMDDDDTDWGFGSNDRDEAISLARSMDAKYIAVIKMGDDPVCVDTIEEF